MIIAEPQNLEKLIMGIPKLKTFQSKHFPLYNCLATLYEGSIAIGDLNFTSTETTDLQPPLTETTENNNHINLDAPDVSLNLFFKNMDGQRVLCPTDLNEEEHTSSSCSEQKGDDNGKKKQNQVAGVLQNYLNFKTKQSKVFMEDLNETTKPKDDCSIKNCLGLLESIEKLSDEKKTKVTSIFKCEVNREIFINFKKPRVRILWVKGEIAPKG